MPIYNEALEEYHRRTFAEGDPVMHTIRERISDRGLPEITVKPEEGRFLQFLVAASGGELALEIGTHGGYSGTWIARGLRPTGTLITVEKDPSRGQVAMDHFQHAGVAGQVELLIGDVKSLLGDLEARAPYNFIFVDAEKEDYPAMFTWAAGHLVIGGIFVAHNAFRRGAVANPDPDDLSSLAVHRLNQQIAADPNFISSLYPAGDGMVVGVYIGSG